VRTWSCCDTARTTGALGIVCGGGVAVRPADARFARAELAVGTVVDGARRLLWRAGVLLCVCACMSLCSLCCVVTQPATEVGVLGTLALSPVDACGNATRLELNRQLSVLLRLRNARHAIDAFVTAPSAGATPGELRALFFPTRLGVYDVVVMLDGMCACV
jgi:hypothetical protein